MLYGFIVLIPANPVQKDFWLGAYDLVNEGTWVWVKKNDYVTSGFTHWAPGEPNGGTNENCLGLFDGLSYQWNDAPCQYQEGFICEVPYVKIFICYSLTLQTFYQFV